MTDRLTIRPARLASSDHELLINFKDCHLEWLSTIGSIDQWGTKPARESNPSVTERCRLWVERSEQNSPWGGGWCRAFLAATPSGAPVAGLVLESKSPASVRSILPERDENDPFVYVAYLISNRMRARRAKALALYLLILPRSRLAMQV